VRQIKYYALLLNDDVAPDSPDAIFRSVRENGLHFERLDRAEGKWVEDDSLFAFFQGEPGAEPISREHARRIAKNWRSTAAIRQAQMA
jgi:hypothetical protein